MVTSNAGCVTHNLPVVTGEIAMVTITVNQFRLMVGTWNGSYNPETKECEFYQETHKLFNSLQKQGKIRRLGRDAGRNYLWEIPESVMAELLYVEPGQPAPWAKFQKKTAKAVQPAAPKQPENRWVECNGGLLLAK